MMCCKPKAALEPSLGDLPASVEQLKSCPRPTFVESFDSVSWTAWRKQSRQGCRCTSTVLPGVACDSLRCVWVVCTLSLLLVGLRFCSCAVLDGHQSAVADDTSLQCGTRCCVFESLSERFKALVFSDFQRVEPVTATDSGGQVPGWLWSDFSSEDRG